MQHVKNSKKCKKYNVKKSLNQHAFVHIYQRDIWIKTSLSVQWTS